MEGSTLGFYRIESELGSGGMGKVYLAEVIAEAAGLAAGTRVAIKVVHPYLLSEPGFFKRFLREAEIGQAVSHPNIVRCYDRDQLSVDGSTHAFLVMEYVEGQTLRELLEELETVPEELCRHIGREVTKGLAAIHAAGAIHRDLKPENILITPEHEVKIMDLGLARLVDQAIKLSRSGEFVGSPLYAAPEQFLSRGRELDGRADLFSLGVILYELSSGVHPHRADDFNQVLAKLMEETPRRLGERNPQLSAYFEEVVHGLLRRDREERILSAEQLLEVLEQSVRSTWWGKRAREIRAATKRPLRRVRIPRETAVYGREGEFERLLSLFAKAKAGDGQAVLIEGEAGIGKTRLVDELVGRLQQEGEDLNFLFGSYPPGGAATASGAWSTAFREQFGAEGLEETLANYLTITPVLIPAFAALLRGEPPLKGEEPLTKDSIHTVFVHATRALAAERPTVVLIEDLHFAPEEGRALLAALALAVPEHRILLIGTTRPGLPEQWTVNLDRLDHAHRLPLDRLGPKHLGKLLIETFHSQRLADELGWQIALKSDGNPFFVFEIIRGLREGRFITKGPDGTWVSTQVITEIQIPSSVLDLVQARISDLEEMEQELLDVAACCGFEFDPELVAEVVGMAPIPALRALGHLGKSHRLVRSAGRFFVFDHHQVQESLYEGLSDPLKRRYHAAIGEALEARHSDPAGATAVDLAEHFLKGGRGQEALRHLDAALDHLEKGYLNDQAVALADRALSMEGLLTGARRAEVLLRRAARLDLLASWELQEASLEEAVALAEAEGEPGLRSRARRAVGRSHWGRSRYDEALEELRLSRELAIEIGDREGEGIATGILGIVYWSLGSYEEAREHYEHCLALARETGDRRGEANSTGNLGLLFHSLGRYEEAREQHEQHLLLAREIGDRRGEANATGNLGLVFYSLGRYEEAQQHYEGHHQIAREIGDRRGESGATGNLGLVFYALGRSEEAREHHELHLAMAREIGDREGESRATGNLGLVFHSLGRYEEAREHYERYLAIANEIGDRRGEAAATGNLGSICCSLGCGEEARVHHERFLAIARESGARREEGYALHGLAEVAEAAGDAVSAKRLCEEALALRREIEYPSGIADTLAVLGRILRAEEREDEAQAHLTEALALGRGIQASGTIVLATSLLAHLPGADPAAAVRAFAEHEDRLGHAEKMEARFLLWQVTRDPVHLENAIRLLKHLTDAAPEDCRETMIANVPLHRDIIAAWEEHRAEI